MNHNIIFKNIYETRSWGGDINTYFKGNSGPGSDVEYNKEYICFLKNFIINNQVQSVVDLGCGDWRCGKDIYESLSCTYIGYDIYQEMIDSHILNFKNPLWGFECKNCLKDLNDMKKADLLIVKDVLQHWTDVEISRFMSFQSRTKRYKYILITNCSYNDNITKYIKTGEFRTLNKEHVVLKKYNLIELFKYNTKTTLLFIPK